MRSFASGVLAALWLAAATPCGAYPVNFGTSYVPAPTHGLFVSSPSAALDGKSFASWNYVGLGVSDRLGIGLELLYLGIPGLRNDLGNATLSLHYAVGEWAPGVRTRFTQTTGVRSGDFGRPQLGLTSDTDWRLSAPLTAYASLGYYYQSAGASHRLGFNTALDYRFLPWLGGSLELLTGFPAWDFGPGSRLGLAPGLTLYAAPFTLLASLRFPLLGSEGGPSKEPPSVVIGWGYGW